MNPRVLFVTSEIDDYVRVGGLAAVSAALPRALRSRMDVRVLIPGYPEVLQSAHCLTVVGKCEAFASIPACTILRAATNDGLPIYVVDCEALFNRCGTPYGDENGRDWADNDVRFARLASAGAALAAGEVDPDWSADLLHANDWQSALAPAYLAWRGVRIPSILTIHNLAYQGLFSQDTLRRIGAPADSFHIDGVEFYDKVSFLKAGLVYASHLTTVSRTYAQEITTPEFGCGLDGLLQKRMESRELSGIINGIDDSWDASTCAELTQTFAPGEWRAREANADQLRKTFNLAVSDGPLFGLVARLVHQKGVDLVLAAQEAIVSAGGQVIVMGRGEPALERALVEAESRNPGSIRVALQFDDAEARRIFAGSDFTLMPSRFEPCGLSQMYAQRFGSLPIGHRTGGLAETIHDGRTGFLFSAPSTESFLGAICRAFSTFGSKTRLNDMRSAAMAQTFSWNRSAESYSTLYKNLAAAA